jgi:hypothetical protein
MAVAMARQLRSISANESFLSTKVSGDFMAHTKIRSSLLSLAVVSTLVMAAPVFAQTAPAPAPAPAPASDHTFSGNIGIASSYIYRGLNQSDYKPAFQAGLDYSHASGFYIGAWASSQMGERLRNR